VHGNSGLAKRSFRLRLGLLVAVVAGLALFAGTACGGGGGDGDAAEVEAALRAFAEAWNGKDVEGLLALVTDNFISEQLEGATREQAAEALPEFIGETPIENLEISDVEVSGDTATAIFEFTEGKVVTRESHSLLKEGEAWKLDSEEKEAVEIPDDVTAVDLQMTEYQFIFDENAITDGNIAFNVSNIGSEQHFAFLAKVPEDLDIEQALQSPEQPEGVEDIGGTDPLDPQGDTTLVFAEVLEAGRYVLLCFVQAEDGEEHALKGMVGEFTIE